MESVGVDGAVAVMGMHRSGTSATAGMLVDLGLSGPRPEDLIPASSSNETGHWESREVRRCNVQLLRAVGSIGFAPPAEEPQWGDLEEYEALRARAAQWFVETSAGSPVMVKDPRMCLTLTFWRQACPGALATVLILRNPLRVARSLEARDGVPMSLGLSLWDRHMRLANAAMAGLPTLVLEYDAMLRDPDRVGLQVCDFLEQIGISLDAAAKENATGRIDPRLRHQDNESDEYERIADAQLDSFALLQSLQGPHAAWEPPPLPTPQLWVDDVIRLRRKAAVLEDAERQRRKRLAEQGPARRIVSTLKGRMSS